MRYLWRVPVVNNLSRYYPHGVIKIGDYYFIPPRRGVLLRISTEEEVNSCQTDGSSQFSTQENTQSDFDTSGTGEFFSGESSCDSTNQSTQLDSQNSDNNPYCRVLQRDICHLFNSMKIKAGKLSQ